MTEFDIILQHQQQILDFILDAKKLSLDDYKKLKEYCIEDTIHKYPSAEVERFIIHTFWLIDYVLFGKIL